MNKESLRVTMASQVNVSKPPAVINMLSDTNRWNIVQYLMNGNLTSSQIAEKLNIKTNALTYHLNKLYESGIISKKQGEDDKHETYYSVNLETLNHMYKSAGFETKLKNG